jgi:hypothetical protein
LFIARRSVFVGAVRSGLGLARKFAAVALDWLENLARAAGGVLDWLENLAWKLTKWPLAGGNCRQLVDSDYMPVTALPHCRITALPLFAKYRWS